jgi:hypothetical protein
MLSPVYEAEGSGNNGNMFENANATGVINREGSTDNIASAHINSNLTNANVENAQPVNLNRPNMKPLPVPLDELAYRLKKLVSDKFYNISLFGSNAGTNHYKTQYLPQVKAYLNILSKTHPGLRAYIAEFQGKYSKDLPLLRELKEKIDNLAAENIPSFVKPGHVKGGRRGTKKVKRSRRRYSRRR